MSPAGTRSTFRHFRNRVGSGGFLRAADSFHSGDPAGASLFYVSPDGKLMAVSLKPAEDSLEPSSPRELFPVPYTEANASAFDVSSDGRRILVRAQPQQASPPLVVIVNWPALLKKGAPAP